MLKGALPPLPESPESRGRVLILDDDSAVGQTVGRIVADFGLEWRLATESGVFFQLLDQWRPSDIVLDLMMPDMDGLEVIAQLASRRCNARIIIMSGVAGRVLEAAQRLAVERGLRLVEIIPKPFTRANLRRAFERDCAEGGRPAGARRRRAAGDIHVTDEEIRQAIRQNEFQLVYQPKVRCADCALIGFEALIRWRHPALGMIMPDSFIPRAEEIGLIGEITEYVLEHGMRWLVDIDPTSRYSLSINLSARSLGEPRFADHVSDVCRKHAIEPQRIVLELTETAATEDPVAALDLMTRLRVKGFQVSIDDFGTGYSSMAQLAHLPFSEIKVDKTFVIAAGVSEEARSIIKSTVDLGHTLGMQVTAEGVESQDNLDYLCATGCDYAQGYFIARPMSGDVVAAWIAGRQSRDQ